MHQCLTMSFILWWWNHHLFTFSQKQISGWKLFQEWTKWISTANGILQLIYISMEIETLSEVKHIRLQAEANGHWLHVNALGDLRVYIKLDQVLCSLFQQSVKAKDVLTNFWKKQEQTRTITTMIEFPRQFNEQISKISFQLIKPFTSFIYPSRPPLENFTLFVSFGADKDSLFE